MRLIRREADELAYEMSTPEKMLFLGILNLYPQVPAAHYRLTQESSLPDAEANQQLLKEALSAQTAESRQWVKSTLSQPERLKKVENGFCLTVKRAEIEMLLQIFNDVRVGSWLSLGSPELEKKPHLAPTVENARFLQQMELAGFFEMFFLQSIEEGGAN